MRLQGAQADLVDLGVAFTGAQIITQALQQFIKHHGKDGRKSANKWTKESAETKQSWKAFKIFWKKEIHEFDRTSQD